MFIGFVQQEETLVVDFLVSTQQNAPANLDALPSWRVYGPAGLMSQGTGTASLAETGAISAASFATPIVITSAAHGLTSGQLVTVSGVAGNDAANGTWVVTVIDADTFSLLNSAGDNNYTSGGLWNTTGVYQVTLPALGALGYAAGVTYALLVFGTLTNVSWADLHTFCVG